MKKLSKRELETMILEDWYVPAIRKGEVFEMDGEVWICTGSSETRFKAKRLRQAESKVS